MSDPTVTLIDGQSGAFSGGEARFPRVSKLAGVRQVAQSGFVQVHNPTAGAFSVQVYARAEGAAGESLVATITEADDLVQALAPVHLVRAELLSGSNISVYVGAV